MAEDKVESVAFDPRAPQHRRKLWVRVQTSAGRRLVVFWPRVGALAVALLILAWLGLATTAWAFVRYQRGVAAVRWADVAVYPWRPSAYRATLGRHYLAVGKAQLDQERWNEGVSSLRAAVAYAPGLTEARRILADFYVAVKQPARARQILEDGLPQVRDDAAYLERLFRLCGETNDWARIVRLAETRLPAAPDADPRHRQVALRAAQALGQLRRWDEAEAWLRRWGLEDGVDGQLLLADRDLARGEPEAARRRLEAALAANPANELLALQLTRWYRQAGRLVDARRVTLLRTLAQPASPGARIDLFVLDHELGRHADFAQGVEAFLATHAGDGAALQLLARMAGELADPDLATRLLDLAGRAGHPLLVFRFGVLQAQCAAGRYADALATATEIDRDRDRPRAGARAPGGRDADGLQMLGALRERR